MTSSAADDMVLEEDAEREGARKARHEWPKKIESIAEDDLPARTKPRVAGLSVDAFWALVDD